MAPSWTDKQLIQNLLKGGSSMEQGMSYLYHQSGYKEAITKFLHKKSASEATIEDIFQEGICQLIMNIRTGQFKEKSSLKTYFIGICRNVWLTQIKQQAQQNKLKQALFLEVNTPSEVIPSYLKQSKLLNTLLLNIGVDCKKVLSLWSLGYSMEEIAVEAGYKNANVTSKKKHLCLKKLKAFLNTNPSVKEKLLALGT